METEAIKKYIRKCEHRLLYASVSKSNKNRRLDYRDASLRQRQNIEHLLHERKHYLNSIFLCTESEIKRLRQLNERLTDLTRKMYNRAYQLYQNVCTNSYNEGFDDDIEIEGTLQYVWNSQESSYLAMEEDAHYGSDFPAMMEYLDDVLYYKNYPYCAFCHVKFPSGWTTGTVQATLSRDKLDLIDELDDGTSWNEYPLDREEFHDITFCYAIHELLCHQYWSLPDVLRMNDFWCEVKVTYQHLVDLAGSRSTLIGK